MNTCHVPFRTFAASALLGALPALAQSVTPPASAPRGEDEVIQLSVFEVVSAKDSPYVADKSVATTGFAADLSKIPLAINVVTDQFLRDTAGIGFNGIVAYQAGITTDQGGMDNGGRNTAGVNPTLGAITGGEPLRTRMRGQPINLSQRNGLPMMIGFSTDNVNRVEVARGPMAVFVGGSTLGGVINLITDKPSFQRSMEFRTSYDSNDSFVAKANLAGPLLKGKLAYRLIALYSDDNTWRDFSASHTRFFNPQVTWRPFQKVSTRLEYARRDRWGNSVSHAQQSTQNYQNDYDTPPQALLDLGKTRTTGAGAGQPYTVAEYRTRIGRAFATWRSDRYAVYGKWVTLGEGEGFVAGDWASGVDANHFGANDPYSSTYDMVESETNIFLADWLEVRLLGRWANQHSETLAFGNALRRYPDGSTPLANGFSTKRDEIPVNGKVEAVLTRDLFRVNHKLLLGYEAAYNQAWSVNPVWNYTKLAPVAASPNVIGSPATLTGSNIFAYFDPRVHAIPDYKQVAAFADAVYADGVAAQFYTRSFPEAGYVAYSAGFWKDRITVFGGYRNSITQAHTWSEDRNRTRLQTSGITDRQSTQSHTYGIVIEPFPGFNLYASENVGADTQTGSLINPYTSTYAGLISQEEREANRVPDLEGYGRELGLKLELFDRKLIGRLGVFDLSRRNTIVVDNERTANDPRNVGTQVDPNPATQNTAQTARVQWNRTIDGNRSSGLEIGFTWQPTRQYTAVLEASHLWTNKLTVSKPASTSPTVLMDYMILNGRPLDNTPDDTLKVWQKYAFTDGRLKSGWIGFGVRAQTSVMPAASTSSWGTVLRGWVVYDLALGYTVDVFRRPVQLQVNVENLTDELYSAGGRSYSPPRQWTLQATTRF
ncbi:TonB-dependent receptor plug domain-containing protein [Opitutus sp. ER46]|uniref:TonB-dependent siderophore receptor n=1 Tax=Opitutus sp. ER46 TaxID=2161864 RepID=UPI001304D36F|nr:TonB-dependent receptor plug domain-containing protein [Opitutus sp. ER46]